MFAGDGKKVLELVIQEVLPGLSGNSCCETVAGVLPLSLAYPAAGRNVASRPGGSWAGSVMAASPLLSRSLCNRRVDQWRNGI